MDILNKTGGEIVFKISCDKFLLAFAKSEMTTTELKLKSGVGRNTISRIVNGNASVRPSIAGKLAKALNVDVKELFFQD